MTKGFFFVEEKFHKFYICDACGTNCYMIVTNSHDALPRPDRCPYRKSDSKDMEFSPANWREYKED